MLKYLSIASLLLFVPLYGMKEGSSSSSEEIMLFSFNQEKKELEKLDCSNSLQKEVKEFSKLSSKNEIDDALFCAEANCQLNMLENAFSPEEQAKKTAVMGACKKLITNLILLQKEEEE